MVPMLAYQQRKALQLQFMDVAAEFTLPREAKQALQLQLK